MSNFYSWMFCRNESIAQDEEKIVYRKHPDGTPCYAKDPKDCPVIRQHMKADEADDLNDTGVDDAAYMEAVKNGDMETCAKMVRDAAAKAMPDTKVVDEDGFPKVVYHGTISPERFTEFQTPSWFSSEKFAEGYNENGMYSVFLDVKMPFDTGIAHDYIVKNGKPTKAAESIASRLGVEVEKIVDMADKDYAEYSDGPLDMKTFTLHRSGKFADFLKSKGSDGIVSNEGSALETTYAPLNPSQIKSADPVTFDDSGNPIPLSKRFDFTNPDIRY